MNDAQAPRKVSVEVTLYPLRGDYIPPIDAFIDRVKQVDRVEVRCTDLSTQVFGDYDLVMDLLRDVTVTGIGLIDGLVRSASTGDQACQQDDGAVRL